MFIVKEFFILKLNHLNRTRDIKIVTDVIRWYLGTRLCKKLVQDCGWGGTGLGGGLQPVNDSGRDITFHSPCKSIITRHVKYCVRVNNCDEPLTTVFFTELTRKSLG